MTPTNETVVAGSRGFALALLGPLTERIGTRPRIAADPVQALAHCSGPGDLVVVEFLGSDTLCAIETLVHDGRGVRVLAALPESHASAREPLRALGVEIATWDGTAAGVLAAVLRHLSPSPPAAGALPAAKPVPPATPSPSRAAAPAVPPWPSQVPGEVDAAAALEAAMDGDFPPPGAPLACVADVVASLSEIERDVMMGMLQPFEPEAIRRSAVMRVRVAAALATAPPPGGDADAAAVSAFLAEIDALLPEVSALAAGAPPETSASLQAVRNALVREAIEFSEAAQRASPVPGSAEPRVPRRTPLPRAPQTRLVSVERPTAASRPRAIGLSVALAVAAAVGAGYHGWSWYRGHAVRAARSAGVPEGMTDISAGPGKPRVIAPATTREVADAAGIVRLKAAEQAKGNVVRQTGGIIVVLPGAPATAPEPSRKP